MEFDSIIQEKRIYLVIKRIFDIVIGLLVLPFLIVLIILVGFFIKIDSKGPIIYTQKRLGKNGKEFNIFKFRSMCDDAEDFSGAVVASENDPRITKVGNFLRKHRIDELPQFINVLNGTMSLIGPRPEREELAIIYEEETPDFSKRLLVKPGITGWAQVNADYSVNHIEKLRYDLEYIQNMSFIMDFKIIFMTIFVVILGKGSR